MCLCAETKPPCLSRPSPWILSALKCTIHPSLLDQRHSRLPDGSPPAVKPDKISNAVNLRRCWAVVVCAQRRHIISKVALFRLEKLAILLETARPPLIGSFALSCILEGAALRSGPAAGLAARYQVQRYRLL